MAQSPIAMTVLLAERNGGHNVNQNKAVRNSTGDLMAFCASDDLLAPNRFREQADLLAANPDVKIVYANGRVFNTLGTFGRVHDEDTIALLGKSAPEILRHLYTHVGPLYL